MVVPQGMRRSACQTFFWNGVPLSSTGTVSSAADLAAEIALAARRASAGQRLAAARLAGIPACRTSGRSPVRPRRNAAGRRARRVRRRSAGRSGESTRSGWQDHLLDDDGRPRPPAVRVARLDLDARRRRAARRGRARTRRVPIGAPSTSQVTVVGRAVTARSGSAWNSRRSVGSTL